MDKSPESILSSFLPIAIWVYHFSIIYTSQEFSNSVFNTALFQLIYGYLLTYPEFIIATLYSLLTCLLNIYK